MKTSIDLPPDLLRSVATEGTPLPELVVGLLRDYLAKRTPPLDPPCELLDWREELL